LSSTVAPFSSLSPEATSFSASPTLASTMLSSSLTRSTRAPSPRIPITSHFSSTKSFRANSQLPLVSGTIATQGVDGLTSEGSVLVAVATKATKPPDSSSESSITPVAPHSPPAP
jgi:hypothetical protein